jgi:hypothetical protein
LAICSGMIKFRFVFRITNFTLTRWRFDKR